MFPEGILFFVGQKREQILYKEKGCLKKQPLGINNTEKRKGRIILLLKMGA